MVSAVRTHHFTTHRISMLLAPDGEALSANHGGQHAFRPEILAVTWNAEPGQDWHLRSVLAHGPRLRKDGTPGQYRDKREFVVHRDLILDPETPHWVLRLLDDAEPPKLAWS